MRSRSARRCCSLGRMGSLRHGQRRCGPSSCGIIPFPVPCQLALRVCEMEAEVRVYLRDRSLPAMEVMTEQRKVLAEKARQGVSVIRT